MSFVLKIYFFGMIAFVPNTDGRQMTALVIDARPGFHASDGTAFPSHYPVLLARAGSCKGNCQEDAQRVADHLFGTGTLLNPAFTRGELKKIVGEGGGTWELDGEHITLQAGTTRRSGATLQVVRNRRPETTREAGGSSAVTLPKNLAEAEDFSWVAEIKEIVPEARKVDPDCLKEKPEKGLVVGRVKLEEGTLKTHRLIQFKEDIPRFIFQPLSASAPTTSYSQGLADWTVAEIPITGCEVTINSRDFATGETRSMTLGPSDCQGGNEIVEVAVMNVPDPSKRHDHPSARGNRANDPQAVGTHFELYYELAQTRPSWKQKAVPVVDAEAVKPADVDPGDVQFLKVLNIPRAGTYSHPICPQAVFEPDPNG